ncbi:Mu-like prophage major head subunit gpT family protein, partial [Escherichia coli]
MGQTVSSEILHALTTCLSAAFTRGLSGVEPQWNRIASEVPSSSASNTYGWMKDLPDIKEWVGERQLATLDGYGYTITNKLWESSIRVKREHI